MRRSAYRRGAAPSGGNRRLLAVGAVIAALGAVVAFTTISSAAENDAPEGSGAGKVVNGQVILTDTCVDSDLPPHDGFQKGDRCVSTEFGEVSSAQNNPSLLITQAPRTVEVNTAFTLKVSTKNLIRDRFLAAGQGGYYVESSILQDGIERGHFHTACRMLTSTTTAPDPEPVPAFFVATEDKKGGRTADEVTIQVAGLPQEGTAQCASWAGDGSHRIPMMERANETPAFDAVRIRVTATGNNNGGQNGDDQNGDGDGDNGDGGQQGNNNGGGNDNGGNATTAPTTAPAQAAGTTQPSTKNDFTPKATVTTTKSAEPESSTAGTSEDSEESGSDTASTESDTTESTTKETAKPKASKSSEAAAGTDYTYSNDDGVVNSGEDPATTLDQVASKSDEQQTGLLALTGSNTIVFLGGAVVLMMAGLAVMALTRRRRPGTPWQ